MPRLGHRHHTSSPTISVRVTGEPDSALLAQWDTLVRSDPASDVTQLSAWAHIRAHAGYSATYVFAFDTGRLVAGAQLHTRHVSLLGALGYLAYGPVISPLARDGESVHTEMVNALAQLAATGLRMLVVQPPDGMHETSRQLLGHGFRPSGAGIAPGASMRLDLRKPRDELRSGLNRRLRSMSRQWPNRGVRVRRGTEDDIGLLAELLRCSARRQHYEPPSAEYLRGLWRHLAPDGHAAIFIGEVNGRPAAADLFTMCGEIVRSRLTGFDRSASGRSDNVPAAVAWETICWAQEAGYRWFDLGGIGDVALRDLLSGPPYEHSTWRSADQFKARFGAAPYRYPQPVELIRPAALRVGYDLARSNGAGRAAIGYVRDRLRGIEYGGIEYGGIEYGGIEHGGVPHSGSAHSGGAHSGGAHSGGAPARSPART